MKPFSGIMYGEEVTGLTRGCTKTKVYMTWRNIFLRCYFAPDNIPGNESYRGCSVSKMWHDFENFKIWHAQHYKLGFHLDKDLLVPGNREYGPDACSYIPRRINNLFTDHHQARGFFPIGVSRHQNGFQARVHDKGEVYLGMYCTYEEAHEAWRWAKKKISIKVAKEALSSGDISEKLYESIIKRVGNL